MDYTSRYGLELNPFVKSRAATTLPPIQTSQYKEIITRLEYLHQIKGFGLLTGNPGVGKTTTLRYWTESLNKAANKIIYVSLSTLTVSEFYRFLAQELGCEPAYQKTKNFCNIQAAIVRLNMEKKMTPIIILDEANYMSNAVLNDLKILFNFDMDSSNRAVVILSGLPQLVSTLNLNSHEPLRQRITMNYMVSSLSPEESKQYLEEKLKLAKCHQIVFERNAEEAIVGAANGLPRMIDRIADKCLLYGNTKNESIISAETVMAAVNDLQL